MAFMLFMTPVPIRESSVSFIKIKQRQKITDKASVQQNVRRRVREKVMGNVKRYLL